MASRRHSSLQLQCMVEQWVALALFALITPQGVSKGSSPPSGENIESMTFPNLLIYETDIHSEIESILTCEASWDAIQPFPFLCLFVLFYILDKFCHLVFIGCFLILTEMLTKFFMTSCSKTSSEISSAMNWHLLWGLESCYQLDVSASQLSLAILLFITLRLSFIAEVLPDWQTDERTEWN